MPSLALPITRAVILAPRTVAAAPPGGSSPPGGVTTNLILWLEGDQLALSDGAAVSSWTDMSSVANHATQATSTKRPTYRATGGPNSKPCVEFDGGDGLVTGNLAFSGSTCSYYIVANVTVDATDQVLIERSVNYNTNGPGFISFRNAANKVYSGIKGNAGLNDMTSVASLQSTPALVSVTIDRSLAGGTPNELMAYLNGTVGTRGVNADNTDTFGSSHPLYIGARNQASLFLTGKISLILVYDAAHDTTTRQSIETAINTKYALGF